MARKVDWVRWHQLYDDPSTNVSKRLALLQGELRRVLDDAPPGPISIVSLCAGQGHDVLAVLADHPRAPDARTTLVELSERNLQLARERAASLGVEHVSTVAGDAGLADTYAGLPRATVLLLSGFTIYLSDDDLVRLVNSLGQLCDHGATVLWTKRYGPKRTRAYTVLRDAMEARSEFEELHLATEPNHMFAVGVYRFIGEPAPLATGTRYFTFQDLDATTYTTKVLRRLRLRPRGRRSPPGVDAPPPR